MTSVYKLKDLKNKRKRRVRAKIRGTSIRPRLSVFRSNKHIYIQLIDDAKGETLLGISDKILAKGDKSSHVGIDAAKVLGSNFAKAAKKKGLDKVVFDRASYAYHGRIKAVAEGAREGGLQF